MNIVWVVVNASNFNVDGAFTKREDAVEYISSRPQSFTISEVVVDGLKEGVNKLQYRYVGSWQEADGL